jgi:hypothetical protein
VNIGDEVFVASYYNKKGKITSMIDNALVAGNKLLVITFDDGTELLTAALFVKTPVYSLERVQAMMKWAGIKPIDDDAAEKAKEKAEKAKKARLAEIKTKIGTPSLIQGLAETTKESNSLTLEGVYNGDLIQYWQEILALVPQLKTLTIKGTDKEKLVIGKYASPQIDA